MIKTPLSTVIGGAFWTPGATIIGSSSQNLTQLIKSLFSDGEQGFAYDPNDLSTLYQDAAGTIPVTAQGQPVGLMLDKSKGLALGSNITQAATAVKTADGTSSTSLVPHTILNYGKWYQISGTVDSVEGVCWVSGAAGGTEYTINTTTPKNFKVVILAGTLGLLRIYGQTTSRYAISGISVKELAGNHAYQTVSAMRPLLVAAPQRLDYDAVDDKLITNLPAQLTGCTVVRSVPNVGTQILTNQTVPTPYNDNIDNCGLIVINRALTASETSQITKLFNKAAGV